MQRWSWLQVGLDLGLKRKQDHLLLCFCSAICCVGTILQLLSVDFASSPSLFSWCGIGDHNATTVQLLQWHLVKKKKIQDSFWLDQLRSHDYSRTNHRVQRDIMQRLVRTWGRSSTQTPSEWERKAGAAPGRRCCFVGTNKCSCVDFFPLRRSQKRCVTSKRGTCERATLWAFKGCA